MVTAVSHPERRLAVPAVVAVLFAVLVIVAAFLLFVRGSGGTSEGPLALPRAGEHYIYEPIPLKTMFSFGGLDVVNRSTHPVVVDTVKLVGAGSGIKLAGAYMLARPNNRMIGFVEGFDPRPGGRKLGLVPPHSRVQVVIGLKVVKQGRYRFQAVRLLYHGKHVEYSRSYPVWAQLCAPYDRYYRTCNPAQG
jgi:hypothetical protein